MVNSNLIRKMAMGCTDGLMDAVMKVGGTRGSNTESEPIMNQRNVLYGTEFGKTGNDLGGSTKMRQVR